ncbi:hypothetical protein V1511DRAFT_163383 [Dipodascopsis uninucleata]
MKIYFSKLLLVIAAVPGLVNGEAKTPGIVPLRPWTRTAPDGAVQTVTPVIVEGITISARPPVVTPTAPIPWISLKNNGAPVTIKPKVKKEGITEKASPTYGTWFAENTGVAGAAATAVDGVSKTGGKTQDKNQQQLLSKYFPGEFERLNPVIRCTPEKYLEHGELAPFCSPFSNTELMSGHAYFITWYSKYFNDTKVRINLLDYDTLAITSPDGDIGTEHQNLKEFAFYTTDWIDNELGYYYLEIDSEWLKKRFERAVYIQIESPNEAIEDLNVNHVPLVKFIRLSRAHKDNTRYQNQTLEVVLAVPSIVGLFIVFLVAFHFCTKKARQIKMPRASRKFVGRSSRPRGIYEQLNDTEAGMSESKNYD